VGSIERRSRWVGQMQSCNPDLAFAYPYFETNAEAEPGSSWASEAALSSHARRARGIRSLARTSGGRSKSVERRAKLVSLGLSGVLASGGGSGKKSASRCCDRAKRGIAIQSRRVSCPFWQERTTSGRGRRRVDRARAVARAHRSAASRRCQGNIGPPRACGRAERSSATGECPTPTGPGDMGSPGILHPRPRPRPGRQGRDRCHRPLHSSTSDTSTSWGRHISCTEERPAVDMSTRSGHAMSSSS
jgi:hypothetical protein